MHVDDDMLDQFEEPDWEVLKESGVIGEQNLNDAAIAADVANVSVDDDDDDVPWEEF